MDDINTEIDFLYQDGNFYIVDDVDIIVTLYPSTFSEQSILDLSD